MPALPRLSDVYLGDFELGNGRFGFGTRGCGWRLPVGQITADNCHYQTFLYLTLKYLRGFPTIFIGLHMQWLKTYLKLNNSLPKIIIY